MRWKSDPRLNAISPFIVYTATYTAPEDAQLARDLGADAFIIKPLEPDEFIAHLQTCCGSRMQRKPPPKRSPMPSAGENDSLLNQYSETLVRKLEQKSTQPEIEPTARSSA